MMKQLVFGSLLLLSLAVESATIQQNLYIVSGELIAVNDSAIPYLSFNKVDTFSQNNPVINLEVGDSLSLWVHNSDSINHRFRVKGINYTIDIKSGDSTFYGRVFQKAGCFIYFDPLAYPKNSYLGLSGIIAVKDHNHSSFYWNLKEHNSAWNKTLMEGNLVPWSAYYPNYFTINGKSNPEINKDPLARIQGQVGDTLFLYLANTGQSIHSIHFHGYHALVLYSSKNSSHVNRSKDTHPIYPMESLVLMIVPDKPGEYPVHDHNLVAASANNRYPNGMFTTMLITE